MRQGARGGGGADEKWAEKVSANIKPAEDHVEAVLHAQFREKVANLKEGRVSFLQQARHRSGGRLGPA